MKVTVGTGPDSWGIWFPDDPKQIPWHRFLDEAVEAGYEWIELGPYGYLPTDLRILRSELERRGLKVSASYVERHDLEDPAARAALEDEVVHLAEVLAALDARFFVLTDNVYTNIFTGQQRKESRLDDSGWRHLIETVHKTADLVRGRFGLQLVLHPHADTHIEYEDQIEFCLEQTDPDRVSLCLDIGHHAYRGGDPASFMRRYHRRIPYFHIKSVDPEIRSRVEREKIPFATAVKMGMFCEPSLGVVDMPAFRNTLHEVDYEGFATVEQDMYPAPSDKPLPIAKRTRAYLREIGMG